MPVYCTLAFLSSHRFASSERVRLSMRSLIALPFHSAFTLPLRTAAATMNLLLWKGWLWKVFLWAQASPRHFPKQSSSKIIMPKYAVTMPMDWHCKSLYSILALILYSYTRFCWQNQNHFDLEFTIVINMRARARAKYEIGLYRSIAECIHP